MKVTRQGLKDRAGALTRTLTGGVEHPFPITVHLYYVARDAAMTNFTATRVLLILCALVSLCVSDNVGPRLLPLPPAAEAVSLPLPSDGTPATSPTPSQRETDDARVEMAPAPQSRVGAGRHSSQGAAHTLKFELDAPPARPLPGWEDYQHSAESTAPLSRPKGRAPPQPV